MTSEPGRATERIDMLGADDPRDVVHRAVACLAGGGIIAVPTETAYAYVASALRPEAVTRLCELTGRGTDRPFPISVKSAVELEDWVPGMSPELLRLARRAWPGPVTFVCEGRIEDGLLRELPARVRPLVAPGPTIGVRSPAHPAPREIARLMPGPLIMTGARHASEPPVTDPATLETRLGIDMILDDGRTPDAGASTVVYCRDNRWEIRRQGVVTEATLRRLCGRLILFICTGNTCRSPMAEALCKARLAERLGCTPGELEDRGYVVHSAGISAADGLPAAVNAVHVVREFGASLETHQSRRVTYDLLEWADWIVAMTRNHLEAVLHYMPEVAQNARLLDPGGDDIEDPIGQDREVYRETAEVIRRHVDVLLDDIGIPPASKAG